MQIVHVNNIFFWLEYGSLLLLYIENNNVFIGFFLNHTTLKNTTVCLDLILQGFIYNMYPTITIIVDNQTEENFIM